MNLAPLPVDLITDLEWLAGVAVRDARNTPGYFAAETRLDAVTGSIERSIRVMSTIDDAYRALAVAAHPAGVEFLGHRSHALPEHHRIDDRTPGAGEPMDPGIVLAHLVEQRPPRRFEGMTTTPARGGEKAGTARGGHLDARPQTGGRHDLALAVAATIPVAIVVVQLARGGW